MILLLKLKNDWIIAEAEELTDVELGDPDLKLVNPAIYTPFKSAELNTFRMYIPDEQVSQCALRFMDCDTMIEPGPKLKADYLSYVQEILHENRTGG